MKCKKCGKEFEPKKGLKSYCSLSCRNSRGPRSDEVKRKISDAVKLNPNVYIGAKRGGKRTAELTRKNRIQIKCLFCGTLFHVIDGKESKYCSKTCMYLCPTRKENISSTLKEAYINGKHVFGGWTKWFDVETSNGIIRVQGTYEKRVCIILDKLKRLNEIIDWEYTTDRIKYIGIDKKYHNYLLDFKIFTDSDWYYLETKGYQTETDLLKWDAVRSKGYKLVVWFEQDIIDKENMVSMV